MYLKSNRAGWPVVTLHVQLTKSLVKNSYTCAVELLNKHMYIHTVEKTNNSLLHKGSSQTAGTGTQGHQKQLAARHSSSACSCLNAYKRVGEDESVN